MSPCAQVAATQGMEGEVSRLTQKLTEVESQSDEKASGLVMQLEHVHNALKNQQGALQQLKEERNAAIQESADLAQMVRSSYA